MSKYEPLGRFLRRQRTDQVNLTFGEIERLLGAFLPKASRSDDWWTNGPSPHVSAWRSAGFEACPQARAEQVRFQRRPASPPHGVSSTIES